MVNDCEDPAVTEDGNPLTARWVAEPATIKVVEAGVETVVPVPWQLPPREATAVKEYVPGNV